MIQEKEQNPEVQDRRIRKTRAALKRSLTTLMMQKRVKDISVRELTELADVNRGTFYLHYKDVFDLLDQSEADLLEEFHSVINAFDPEKVKNNPGTVFESIYKLCLENADLVRILIGENGDIKFLNKLKVLVREKCLNDWSFILKKQKEEHFDAYYAFVVGGCISLLQYWFTSGMRETPHELSDITSGIINGGIAAISA